ncbi:hypothetical protein CHUV2995_02305 [Corynebacterium diphtheriae subsp. lausannense]|nr:hypothetical protein CHUV2995_02305 [Corynebacterium diphtheriae subsp. lausannense]
MAQIALFCLSQKPPSTSNSIRSATRELLKLSVNSLTDKNVGFEYFDLRETPFPFLMGEHRSFTAAPSIQLLDVFATPLTLFLVCQLIGVL